MSILANRTPLSLGSGSTPHQSQSAASSSPTKSMFNAPQWVQAVYSKFPLVVLEPEESVRQVEGAGELWIDPPSPSSQHHRTWASSSPTSLRVQLLFLLRHVPVTFKAWSNPASAPGGVLPALNTPDGLVDADSIRQWLDAKYPLKGKNKDLQGMPSQETYDHGVALAQLVLGHLLPAYASDTERAHLSFPVPPPLSFGLKAPLPAALTGDSRDIDSAEVVARAKDALEAVARAIRGDWALGAKHPTPLDALLASHIYPLYAYSNTTDNTDTCRSAHIALAQHLATLPELGDYVERVLSVAGAHVR